MFGMSSVGLRGERLGRFEAGACLKSFPVPQSLARTLCLMRSSASASYWDCAAGSVVPFFEDSLSKNRLMLGGGRGSMETDGTRGRFLLASTCLCVSLCGGWAADDERDLREPWEYREGAGLDRGGGRTREEGGSVSRVSLC